MDIVISEGVLYLDVETALYVTAGVLGGVSLILFVAVMSLCCRVSSLNTKLQQQNTNSLRVQKVKLEQVGQHAFNNRTITTNEDLTKRGYSMYAGTGRAEDVESGRRHTMEGTRPGGGQFVEELTREIDHRNSRSSNNAPPFLLQAIEENKRKSRSLQNPPKGNGRTSDTNPNFIY